MKKGNVYMTGGRTFIAATIGRKHVTGLVIEADGLHTLKLPLREAVRPALYKGKPYPQGKMRGHLRRIKAATKGAARAKSLLLDRG